MSVETLFQKQRSALAKLIAVVKTRATGETIIAETFAKTTDEAEKEIVKARKQIAASRKRATDDLVSDYEAKTTSLHDTHSASEAQAEETRRKLRKKTVDQYSTKLQSLRSEYEDKQWAVESIREAGEKEAHEHHDRSKRDAATANRTLEGHQNQVATILAQVGIPWEEVQFQATRLPSPTVTDPVGKMDRCLEDCEAAHNKLSQSWWKKILRPGPTAGMFLICGLLGGAVTFSLVKFPLSLALALGWALFGGLFLRVLLGIFAKRKLRDQGRSFGVFHAEAMRAHRTLETHIETMFKAEMQAVATKHATNRAQTAEAYEPRINTMEKQLAATLAQVETNYTNRMEEIYQLRSDELTAAKADHETALTHLNTDHDQQLADAEKRFTDKTSTATTHRDTTWDKLRQNWFSGVTHVDTVCGELKTFGSEHFPCWETIARPETKFVATVPMGIQYGTHTVDMMTLPNAEPTDSRLAIATPIQAEVPAYLPFPDAASVLIKAKDDARPKSVAMLQNTMLRYLTGLPPGKVRFTIIDPVGLGENFAAFMNLADFDENLVTGRIWTEPLHIEKRLADLTEHMENVIQKYLRNQYKSIEDYNRAAGEVAEPYRVLVIANFPTNFTTEAARRLVSIMSSGPACGVCTLVSVDTRATPPRDFRLADLEQVAYVLNHDGEKFAPTEPNLATFPLAVEAPPAPDVLASIVKRVGKAGKDAARVEVPFEFIMPQRKDIWRGDSSKGFEIPIGRAGATRQQIMTLGKGTSQHALIAGKTGSGKSTLLHALIVNLGLIYSPDEAELYLIDFKKGVEFKAYAEHRLPHAKVVAIESEREFGLSVLQRLDGILRERGDRYRDASANDLAGYREWLKKNKPGEVCPRILFVVDEFQEFFVEDDKLAQEAALLLDRLVRQGRAFGVHVLLGSQTLGGAYSLARSTIDQMAVRIALQCSEADAQLILSKDNTAARLLNRPGEAIYNDANGLLEGNDPFQVVWLDEERRQELLGELRQLGESRQTPPPLVFEGSSTADLFRNPALLRTLEKPTRTLTAPPYAYLGDPIAIKDPTTAIFRPQSAANLLLLGQHEEAALGIMASTLVSILAKLRPATANFALIDGTPDDSEYADYLRHALGAVNFPNAIIERADLATTLADFGQDLERRRAGETDRTPRFLFVHGLHRLRELRKPEDDYGFGKKPGAPVNPGEIFANLLREGPPQGIHVITWCDTLTNFNRAIDRSGLKEFTLRVLFQMSPTDSSQLIDTPAASRLGRHRALFIEEGNERPEKFRPYGLPAIGKLKEIAEQLREREAQLR
ncbi:MAG: FtsK/SpoIIIE domain-containing protein [Fimbriiglobus sp.]